MFSYEKCAFLRPLEDCVMIANNNSIFKIVNLMWRYDEKMLIRPIYLTAINTRPACLSFNFLLMIYVRNWVIRKTYMMYRYVEQNDDCDDFYDHFALVIIYLWTRIYLYNIYNLLVRRRGRAAFRFILRVHAVNRNFRFFFLQWPIQYTVYLLR